MDLFQSMKCLAGRKFVEIQSKTRSVVQRTITARTAFEVNRYIRIEFRSLLNVRTNVLPGTPIQTRYCLRRKFNSQIRNERILENVLARESLRRPRSQNRVFNKFR